MWSQLVRIEKQGSCSSEVFFFTFYPKTFFIVFISFCSHFELIFKVTRCWFSFHFQTIFQPWLHVEERVLDSDGYSTWKCLMGVLLHLKSTCPSTQHKKILVQSLNIYNDYCKTFHNIYIENKSVVPLSGFCFTHWNLRECLNLNISKTYKDKSLKSAPYVRKHK